MSIVSNFIPIKNPNQDPFKSIVEGIFPSPDFSDEEIRRKNNEFFSEMFTDKTSSSAQKSKPSIEFKLPSTPKSSETSTSVSSSSFDSSDSNLSLEEILKQEGVHFRISSGYRGKGSLRNGLTKQGRRSNHNRLDDKGNPLAYDVVPNGVSWKDFKKEIYGNPRIVNYLKSRGWGIIDETRSDIKSRTGATGDHLHIGADTWAQQMLNEYMNNTKLWMAQEGIKVPTELASSFIAQENPYKNRIYFNPESVNPFTSDENERIKSYNEQLFQKLRGVAQKKKETTEDEDPLTNSPFYSGANLPSKKDTSSKQQSAEPIVEPSPSNEKYTGSGVQALNDAITNIAKTNPDIEKYRNLLLFTAKRESNFNSTASSKYSSAYGLFQMIDSTRKYYAPHLSKVEFGKDINAQTEAAYKMMKKLFESEDGKMLKQRGLTDKQIATLGWLGEGYFRTYARTGSAHFSESVKRANGNMDIQDFLNKYK